MVRTIFSKRTYFQKALFLVMASTLLFKLQDIAIEFKWMTLSKHLTSLGIEQSYFYGLGTEYFHVARSLFSSGNYSDPFGIGGGPTAWTSPGITFFLYFFLVIFSGNKSTLAVFYIIFQSWLIALPFSRKIRRTVFFPFLDVQPSKSIILISSVLLLTTTFRFWHYESHDPFFISTFLLLTYYWLCKMDLSNLSKKHLCAWGGWGTICVAFSPAAGLAWLVGTVISCGLKKKEMIRIGIFVAIGLVVGLAPWTIRNYLVFDKVMLSKSNLWFEVYQSQTILPDGIINLKSYPVHPSYSRNPEQIKFSSMGEMAYLESKKHLAIEHFKANSSEFFRKVYKRFMAATLVFTDEIVKKKFPKIAFISAAVHPLPFLSAIFLVIVGWRKSNKKILVLIGMYGSYLFPYILISYYERYGIALFSIKLILVVHSLSLVKALVFENLSGRIKNFKFISVDQSK